MSSRESDPERERGLWPKFRVERTDGSSKPGGKHEHCMMFVLDVVHDEHARPALAAYANNVREEFPHLAADLFEVLRRLPETPSVDPVPRPTSDGRPDAVPPLTPVEAVLAFVEVLMRLPSTRNTAVILDRMKRFCEEQGLGVPRRGWQSIVKRPEEAGR